MNLRQLACFVSVVVDYSSNERVTIIPTLSQSSLFSDDIVVSFGSHLMNGVAEDKEHISELGERFPKVHFVEYQVDFSLNMSEQAGVHDRPRAYWHNLARWTGVQQLKRKQWVFLLDADEVPDGKLVQQWLPVFYPKLLKAKCYRMASFWYFKKPIFQATTLEEAPLLIHYKHLNKENVFGDWERSHLITHSQCVIQDAFKGSGNQVLWHHFSWVRSRGAMTHKLKHWGHADDRFKNVDVEQIVDDIFKDDNVNDIVHRYQYRMVENIFGIQV